MVPWWLETLAIVHGGREEIARRHPVSFLFTPVSPLIVEGPSFDAWLAMRGWDIPVWVMPMPLMGATSPGTRLGTILSTNCEVLGMLCLGAGGQPAHPTSARRSSPRSTRAQLRYAGGAALTR
jgi:trimethylamine--corrinoid protein Co-methyltransferase